MFGSTLVLTGSLMLSAPVYAAIYQGTSDDTYTWTLDDQTDTIVFKQTLVPGATDSLYNHWGSYRHIVYGDGVTNPSDLNWFPDMADSITYGKDVTSPYCSTSTKEYIVDPENPKFASYDGAVYSKDFKILYTVPDGKDSIEIHPDCEKIEINHYDRCYPKKEFTISSKNKTFSVYDGAVYSKDYSTLICVPYEKDTLELYPDLREVPDSQLEKPIQAYKIADSNKYFAVYDGLLYSKDYSTLYSCPSKKEPIRLHANLKTISSFAFRYNDFATPLVLPKGTETLKLYSFYQCTGKLVAPDSIVNVESDPYAEAIYNGRDLQVICTDQVSLGAPYTTVVSQQELETYYSGSFNNADGWKTENGTTYYIKPDGQRAYGWLQIGSDWYYFDVATGALQTGFRYIDYKAYDLGTTGARKHDQWIEHQGDWYYLNSYGAGVVKCWRLKDGKYVYLGADGKMQTNCWIQDYGNWYYVKDDGTRYESSWAKIDGNWYWFGGSGKRMSNGWLKLADGKWYYFGSSGEMYANRWVKTGNYWYYLGSSGAMLTNTTTPDGYRVNASGIRIG